MRIAKHNKAVTLVELIIAMTIMVIIMAAIAPQFRAIRKSWATSEASSNLIQNSRVLQEHITRNLSTAKEIVSVSADSVNLGFIIFKDANDINKRYMVSGGYVLFGTLGSEEQLAGPISKFQVSSFSLDDFDTATTDANNIRLVEVETIFTHDTGTDRTFISEVFIKTGAKSVSDQNVIDIMVKSGEPDTYFDYQAGASGCDAVINIDNWENPSVIHGLLCFKDIVGDANWQIPENTEITEAKLELWYVNHNDNANVYFYRMNVPWTETSTWNSIGGGVNPGVNCDSASAITANLGNSVPATVEIDVTEIVRGWINGDYENYGFGITNSSNNTIQFAAAENTTGTGAHHTPRLIISYQVIDNDPKIAVKTTVGYGGSSGIFDSYSSSAGFYGGANVSQNAVVTSNAIGSSIIQLWSGGILYGDAYIGPGGNPSVGITHWGATITGEKGTLDEPIDFPNPTAPTGPPFSGSHSGNFPTDDWLGGERIIDSDRYYNNISLWSSYITINGDITILLNGDLNVGSGRSIRISPGSSLNLYVRGNCNLGGDLNAHNERLPSNLRIYMLGNNKTFSTWGNGSVYTLLDNPNGAVSLWGSGQFYGRMKAKTLSGGCRVHVDLDSSFEGGGGGGGQSQTWSFGGEILQQEILP
ncbi:MAG: DNRLRE domain-containing protein [Phycisphaerae bacterium]|nr:DNRLRE domain-containing protein [Phycisphaerae bacterium]